jgi:hypothetical protein
MLDHCARTRSVRGSEGASFSGVDVFHHEMGILDWWDMLDVL